MSTPTPPEPEQPTTRIPAATGATPAASGTTPPPGTPGHAPHAAGPSDKPKDPSLPWKVATGVLALTTIGFGIWGFSTNSKLNDLQTSTSQEIASLQNQLKEVEATAGKKEGDQAKEIARLRAEVADEKGKLKVDGADIKKETQELSSLNAEYRKQQQQAAAAEGNLKQQLQASQAKAKLAQQCATVMAAGLVKLYEDVPTVVTYKEVNKVISAASAQCSDIVTLNVQ